MTGVCSSQEYLTENCLHILTENLSLKESKLRCQEQNGSHLTLDKVLSNEMFMNQLRIFVSETRQSIWIEKDENRKCRAFSWNGKVVTLEKIFVCTEKFHPACIFETDNRTCSKEPVAGINSKTKVKTILIASICGGVTVVIFIIIIICCYVKARNKNRSKCESQEATSFELKRYRVSEGFNTPVITDDEIKGSVTAGENEIPYYILENNFNLKRTNDWAEEQNSSLAEIM
ncbi:hypothetical protein LOTGIDRAFT_230455 [Lottia gigantea]|uniref:C-type lectin domain-containing protein n=1 Tax=Lottia gigantea TaxID=225164 RepID=V4AG32_LOTGI|nr:hypothetical protein LOTGIDRAFT_230455 [Lottia gigantea]ESP03004.1 hypothetical protein LOTGIDRAFT_230455 [Lottia gigantea]